MEILISYMIRAAIYSALCFMMEIFITGSGFVNIIHGVKINTRVPVKYLEGYISLYMILVYAILLPLAFEPLHHLISGWFILVRFLIWAVGITFFEMFAGFLFDMVFKFYPWDYYRQSKFKIGKNGYSTWTLIPLWGIAGLGIEFVHNAPDLAVPAIIDSVLI